MPVVFSRAAAGAEASLDPQAFLEGLYAAKSQGDTAAPVVVTDGL